MLVCTIIFGVAGYIIGSKLDTGKDEWGNPTEHFFQSGWNGTIRDTDIWALSGLILGGCIDVVLATYN